MANLSNINNIFKFTDGEFLLIGGATANSINATETGIAISNANAASLSLQNTTSPDGNNFTLFSSSDGSFKIRDIGVGAGAGDRFSIDKDGNAAFVGNVIGKSIVVGPAANLNDTTGVSGTLQFGNGNTAFVTSSADAYVYKNQSALGSLPVGTLTFQLRSDSTGGAFAFVGQHDPPIPLLTINSTGASTFAGIVGMGSTGIYAGTNAQLNLPGRGLAIKNDKNGSDNNWSYIYNTGTLSQANIDFVTGIGTALTLNHDKSATFSGLVSGITPTAAENFATKAYVDAHPSGTVTGSGSIGRVAYWTSGTNISSDGAFRFDGTNVAIGGAIVASRKLAIYNTNADNELEFIGTDFTNIYSQTDSTMAVEVTGDGALKLATKGGNLTIATGGSSSFSGTVTAAKIGIPSSNASYDFYNNGTSYLNGAVTVDAAFTQSGGAASSFSGALTVSGNATASRLFSGDGGNKTNPMIANGSDEDTGIFFPAANTMAFTAGDAEALRFAGTNSTFAGNVSINSTLAPAKNLVVEGNASQYGTIRVLSNSTSHGAEIEFGDSTDADYGSITQFASSAGEGGRMRFRAGGVETMNLRGGNVGIGTTGPEAKLDISNVAGATYALEISTPERNRALFYYNSSSTSDAGYLGIKRGSVDALNHKFATTGNSAVCIGEGNFGIGTDSPNTKLDVNGVVVISPNTDGKQTFELTTNASNDGRFLMRSDTTVAVDIQANSNSYLNGGNVGIGETDPDTTLHVKNSGSIVLTIERSGDGKAVSFSNGIQEVGDISYTGSNGVTYNSASDYRLKEDLQDFNGLDKVSKIKMYDYKWKSSNDRDYGVMAHELQEILPHSVSGEKDGEKMQGVDYSKIVPLLVKSIQEQQKQIKELQDKSCTCNNCNCDK